MGHMDKIATVEMPENIAKLPRDKRGYPIPFTARIKDGQPDFATLDSDKWRMAAVYRLCGVCGKQMVGNVFFIGGTLCYKNRIFFDHPMHKDCATYALKVCPFLAMSRMAYRKEYPSETHTIDTASTVRAKATMLGESEKYHVEIIRGEALLVASPWKTVEWWKDGELTEAPEEVL